MTIPRLVVAGSALFILALLFGALLEPLERMAFVMSFDAATGARIHIGSLHKQSGVTYLRDVRVEAAAGDLRFSAARVSFVTRNGVLSLGLLRPALHVIVGKDTAHRARALGRMLPLLGAHALAAGISGGTLELRRDGESAAPLHVAQIDGSFSGSPGSFSGNARGEVVDSGARYPVLLSGSRLRAADLPLDAAGPLLPSSDLALDGGAAHNVDLTFAGGIAGSIGFRAAHGTYAGHTLSGFHGTLLLAPDGLGTRLLAGSVDGIPLELGGEIHDVGNWNTALREGTKNLRAVARVFGMIVPAAHLRWMRVESTAPGIAFGQYAMQLDGLPRVVQFVTIDPREKTLHFDTALSGDHLISKGERTSQMGVRTHAVAGMNGDYFDIARTYQPQGMLMHGGRLLRGPTNRQALIIDRDNSVHFDEFHLQGTAQIGGRTFRVTQYNSWPLGYVTIVTPDFGSDALAEPGVRYLQLQYVRRDRYRVVAVARDSVPVPVHFGIAIGPDVKGVTLPAPGQEIRLSYHIDPQVNHAVAGIGGGPLLLRNGQWFEDPDAPAPDERDVRWPVDALGVLADQTLIMVAVDGRHPERSIGMTRPEFGKLLQDFGVTDAMALDSGGSVTLVARAPGDADLSVRNVPSDDSAERYVSNGIFVYSSAPVGNLLQSTVYPRVSAR